MTQPTRQETERFEQLVVAEVDGELDEAGRRELEELTSRYPELVRLAEDQKKVKEVVGTMSFAKPPEEVWDRYHAGVVQRLERGVGWVLLSMGAALLLGYGAYHALLGLLQEDVSLWVKLGLLGVALGLSVLLVSLIRERLFLRQRERYDEVVR